MYEDDTTFCGAPRNWPSLYWCSNNVEIIISYYFPNHYEKNHYNPIRNQGLAFCCLSSFLQPTLIHHLCHNPSLGLATKERACKGAGQEWSLGITFHSLRIVGECEEMNPHTPKWGGRWWLPPSSGCGESCESVFAHGSYVHQKCFSYALINLLFGLCRSKWVIYLLVTLLSSYIRALAHPSTLKVLQATERTPIPHSSIVFTLDSHLSLLRNLGVCQFVIRATSLSFIKAHNFKLMNLLFQ
jgi:hypothetical protein